MLRTIRQFSDQIASHCVSSRLYKVASKFSSRMLKTSRAKFHGCTQTLSKLADHARNPSPRSSSHSHSGSSVSECSVSDSSSIASGDHIEISSGRARTHSALLDTVTVSGPRLTHRDLFLCKDAVDVEKLLHMSRRSLFAVAKEGGGSVLLNEQWRCTISRPKFKKQDRFRVKIQYSATMGQSYWPDAQRPVEIEAAKGIEGLMTILDRKD